MLLGAAVINVTIKNAHGVVVKAPTPLSTAMTVVGSNARGKILCVTLGVFVSVSRIFVKSLWTLNIHLIRFCFF